MVAIIQCSFESVDVGEERFLFWAICSFAAAGMDTHLSSDLVSDDLIGLCLPAVFFHGHLSHSLPFLT